MCTIVVALFCKERRPTYLLIMITNLIGWCQGVIDIIGVCFLVLFTSLNYIYLNFLLNKFVKTLLRIIIYTFIAAAALHCLPGFFNILAIHKVKLSTLSIPFSMYINFDKPMIILIAYCMSDLFFLEKSHNLNHQQIIKYTVMPCVWSIPCVFMPAYISGYILFDPHLPNILWIWAMNNFFLVCMAEEVIFRGCLQRAIQNALMRYGKHNGPLAIMFTSFIFGMVHFQGGLTYIGLAAIAGCLYGYSYYKTSKIICPMIVHFSVNLLHLLLFTYPMAIAQ